LDYHARFLSVVAEIERTYPVTQWRVGDVPAWPLARMTVYSNLYWETVGGEEEYLRSRTHYGWIMRAAAQAATPIANIWRRRDDLRHMIVFPHRAEHLFLGDEGTLDRVDGAWQDRFCDPLIGHLNDRAESTLLMQWGSSRNQPWSRPTLLVNTIANWGQLGASALRLSTRLTADFPDHDEVLDALRRNGIPARGLAAGELRKKAAAVEAESLVFEQLLRVVQPSLCFMVGSAPSLALACRRRGVLSVSLQREGRGALHESSCWFAVPENGYATLPAVFWTWTNADASAIDAWSRRLKLPWHTSLCGGHPQLRNWFDDGDPRTQAHDARINEIRSRYPADLEILVALQTHDGYDEVWNGVATLIERTPSSWRWWLRRHPTFDLGDRGFGRLLHVKRPNVLIEEASSLPLPALLRHSDVVLSLRSGAAVEASMFGLKSIFLTSEARAMFPHLLETGEAEIIEDMKVLEQRLGAAGRSAKPRLAQPPLAEMFARLKAMAAEYRSFAPGA
jgi:hypothetical protein